MEYFTPTEMVKYTFHIFQWSKMRNYINKNLNLCVSCRNSKEQPYTLRDTRKQGQNIPELIKNHIIIQCDFMEPSIKN